MALKLISQESDGVLTVHTEFLHESLTPYLEKNVKVISACGEFRSGKSTLLNTWMNNHGVFKVGHTTKAQTKGVWMGVLENPDQVIILLDFEGWYDSQSDTLDIWLPLIMMFISNEVILNVRGSINLWTVKSLLSILIVCKNDAATAKPENWQIPHATIIMRDFDTDHQEGQSDDDYLMDILSANNKHNIVLKKYLGEKKKCYTLPRPHRHPKYLGSLGKDGKIIEAEPEFLDKAQMIFQDILMTHKSTLMRCSDWIRLVLHVTQMIEEIRLSDPQGKRIDMSIPRKELLVMTNTHFAEGMASLDIITKDLQEVKGRQPYDQDQTKKNKDRSLQETETTWGNCDNLSEFANGFDRTVRELNDITAKDYEQLYGTNTSLKGFEAHLTERCHNEPSLKEPHIKTFYLKQHLYLQNNIVTRWMDDHREQEIQRSLAMARVNDKEDCKTKYSALVNYLKQYPVEAHSEETLYSFLVAPKSPDLFRRCQSPRNMSRMVGEITTKEVKHIIHLQNIMKKCYIPFIELQHQFFLLDVKRDLLFGNLLEVYNCCVKFWNIFLEPVCKKMPPVDVSSFVTSWKRVSLVDTFAPLIQFRNLCENMETYIVNESKQNPGLDHFLEWCKGNPKMNLLSANKKTAEHCKQIPKNLKNLLDVILHTGTECPEIYEEISRLEKSLDYSDQEMLQFELCTFTKNMDKHPEAKTINMAAAVQSMMDQETGSIQNDIKELFKAESMFMNNIRLLVLLQDLVIQTKEVHLLGDFDHSIFQSITKVYRSHVAVWKSLENRHSLDIHALSVALQKFTSDLEAHRSYICKEQDTVKYMKQQMSGKTHFATLLKLVVEQEWWKTEADLVDILKEPARHMKMLLSRMGKIQNLVNRPTSIILEQATTSIEEMLETVKEGQSNKEQFPEFERKKALLEETSKSRIEQIIKNTNTLIETSPELCEEFIYCHQEFWVRRSHTLQILKEIKNVLNDGTLGLNITKLITSVAGIASGGLGIASLLLPFLIPVAIAAGVTVGVASVSTVASSQIFTKIMENKISAAFYCDTVSSTTFESAFKKLKEAIELQEMQKILKTPEDNINPVDAICGTVKGVGAGVQAGGAVLKVADVAVDPLAAVGHVAGGIAGGVVILVDAVQIGMTIHDMVKNDLKDERSQYISECIELMELEMEYNAKIAIPLKYHMFKKCIETVMKKQN